MMEEKQTLFKTVMQYKWWWLVPMLVILGLGLTITLLHKPTTERPFIYTVH